MKQPLSGPGPLELEQWLLDEQSPEARERTERQLDPALREQLRDDDARLRARLLAELAPGELARRVHARAQSAERERRAPMLGWALFAAASTACALLLVLRTEAPGIAPPAEPTERAKGSELSLHAYRSRGGKVERLADGEAVAAHDVLQLGYVRAGLDFGVLISIDGRGEVTLHHPSETDGSTALGGDSGEQLLPEAYQLDDAPGFERFVLVASEQALAVDEVMQAARRLAADPRHARGDPLLLSVPTTQRSLLLIKPDGP